MGWNPVSWVTDGLDSLFKGPGEEDKQTTASPTSATTTVTEEGKEEEPSNVTRGRFIPEGEAGDHDKPLYLEAKKHTDRFRKVVESFDEDKQTPVEWLIFKLATFFCYVMPFIIAVPLGMAIGEQFSKGQSDAMALAMKMLSISLEIAVPLMGLATNIAFKRACKDRGSVPGFVSVGVFYLGVSVLNAFALFILLEGSGLEQWRGATTMAMYGRAFGPLIFDIACTIFLAVATVKSLKKYLADQRAKIIAVKDVNAVNIELEKADIQAAIDRQTAIQDMQSKKQRSDTWNQIEQMQSQAMIENAKQNMLDSGGGGSSYRRRLY